MEKFISSKNVIMKSSMKCLTYFSPITMVVILVVSVIVINYKRKRARLVKLIDKIPGPPALPLIGEFLFRIFNSIFKMCQNAKCLMSLYVSFYLQEMPLKLMLNMMVMITISIFFNLIHFIYSSIFGEQQIFNFAQFSVMELKQFSLSIIIIIILCFFSSLH